MLLRHADSLRVRVFSLPLPGTHYGYLATARDIVVSSRLTLDHQRCVLAHELGHLHYGHDLRSRHDVPTDECKADLYAARLLISPNEYALAEALHPSSGAITAELGVFKHLVELWQGALIA